MRRAEHGHCFDQLATIAFLAGCTERLRLLTSVLVVPHRPAVLTAKILATIDVLSNGRLIVGAGAGWMKEEFDAARRALRGARQGHRRVSRGLPRAVDQGRSLLRGKHVSFSDVLFYPKPVQKPHPPIWVGGESPGALRRAIKFGDAWYPGNNSQTKPLDTAPRLAAGIADVKRMCEAAKRDPASLGVTLLVQDVFDWGQHKTQDGSARRMFTGSSADMAADAAALSAIGVSHAALRLGGETAADCVARIERFGAEVIAKMRA